MKYEVYGLRNNIKNRIVYVGQTMKGLAARLKRHQDHATQPGDRLIAVHIAEFGFNNFSIELLQTCYSQPEADAAEELWIRLHETLVPNGCNGWPGSVRGHRPEHSKLKVSRTLMGHPVSAETRKKIKDARKRQPPISTASRLKISATHKGKKLSPERRAQMVEVWKKRKRGYYLA